MRCDGKPRFAFRTCAPKRDPTRRLGLKKIMAECLCHCALSFVTILTAIFWLCFPDEWEKDDDDDEGEWMDVYHSSDEQEEVQSMDGFFVLVQVVILICQLSSIQFIIFTMRDIYIHFIW